METVAVKASRAYQVEIEAGALPTLGARLTSLLPRAKQVMLVSDSTVAALYGETAERALREAGLQVHRFTFPSGEASKTPETLCALWNALAEAGLSRTDCIVALGGGVVGDLSGFAAATYLRGIACYQVPTTLLAMVDSSVGGKTAVDLPAGKNLCGAFSQPVGVLCDPQVLKTLPARVYADGCAEVIKYGYIGDPTLLQMLELSFAEAPEKVIARCVGNKRDVVEADEHDNGARQLLNLGHTGGHAIERLSNFSISHGEAVAIGMLLAAKGAVAKGLCTPDVPAHMEKLLQRYDLPTYCPYGAVAMAEAALSDKKRRGGEITLVLPRKLGESVLVPTPVTALADFFAAGGAKA